MGRIQFRHKYEDIISLDNLLEAWREFVKGKRSRRDLQEFERNLMSNIISLHRDLVMKTYSHSPYHAFTISDPKPRNIHKASVRDRLLHHAIYRVLYSSFDRTFIHDSYSCRSGKGTHKAIDRFCEFIDRASKNHTRTVWVLKCDVRKFFASIDQRKLLELVRGYIPDQDIVWLISKVVRSFNSTQPGKGLPLGNLTSQLLVNAYMNEFDQYVKHKLKTEYYVRYADDFAVLSTDRQWLQSVLASMRHFLSTELFLDLHPHKISLETIASGVDFLGWVHFPDHKVLRIVTKRRMLKNVKGKELDTQTVQSYMGLLSHGNSVKLKKQIVMKQP